MATDSTTLVRCVACGTSNSDDAERCWLCNRPLVSRVSVNQPEAALGPTQFSLSSILLVTTLVGVCLGLVRALPLLILPMVFVVLPALLRTFADTRYRSREATLSIREKIEAFFASLLVVIGTWIAGQVVYLCALAGSMLFLVAGRAGEPLALVCIGLSSLGSLAFIIWLFVKHWPKPR